MKNNKKEEVLYQVLTKQVSMALELETDLDIMDEEETEDAMEM